MRYVGIDSQFKIWCNAALKSSDFLFFGGQKGERKMGMSLEWQDAQCSLAWPTGLREHNR